MIAVLLCGNRGCLNTEPISVQCILAVQAKSYSASQADSPWCQCGQQSSLFSLLLSLFNLHFSVLSLFFTLLSSLFCSLFTLLFPLLFSLLSSLFSRLSSLFLAPTI